MIEQGAITEPNFGLSEYKDVCEVLGIGNTSQALSYLEEDEKGVTINDTPGGNQQVSIVNEPGLYSLILRSRKPEAKLFKRWITHEVLPTIRRTGGAYLSLQKAEEILYNPDLIIGLAQQVIDLRATSEQQQKQIEADRPTMRPLEKPHRRLGLAFFLRHPDQ